MLISNSVVFADITTNISATVANTAYNGTTVTASASANTDGTAVTLLSALGHDCHHIALSISGAAGGTASQLLDILIDPAGGTSWTVFISNILCSGPADAVVTIKSLNIDFPVYLKSGTSIGARMRSSGTGAPSVNVIIRCKGNPSNPERFWCGQGVETLGTTESPASGTSVTPGASGTYGSWTTIGTSTFVYGSLLFLLGSTITSDGASDIMFMQVGYGSTQLAGSPTQYRMEASDTYIGHNSMGAIPCFIKSGTVLQMRLVSSAAGPIANNAAIYGVY